MTQTNQRQAAAAPVRLRRDGSDMRTAGSRGEEFQVCVLCPTGFVLWILAGGRPVAFESKGENLGNVHRSLGGSLAPQSGVGWPVGVSDCATGYF